MRFLIVFFFLLLFARAASSQNLYTYKNYDTKLYGYKDVKEKIVIEAIYDFAGPYKDGLALVGRNGKYGYLDKNGNIAIPIKYTIAKSFCEGFAEVSAKNDKWGFIDKNGNEIAASKYLMTKPFSDGFAAVRLGDAWGFIDITGKEVVPLKYKNVRDFSEGFACAMNDKFKWSIINRNGKEIDGFRYNDMKPFSEGLAAAELNGKWGFVDTIGLSLIRQNQTLNQGPDNNNFWDQEYAQSVNYGFNYEYVGDFRDGMVGIKKDGHWGYMNRSEVIVVKPIYNEVTNFREGIGAVSYMNDSTWAFNWAYIDVSGKFISDKRYSTHFSFFDGFAVVKQLSYPSLYGIINKAGVEVVPCKYKEIKRVSNGFAFVRLENEWIEIDNKGNEIK